MRALLIDDEPDNLRVLELQLARYCPEVDLVGQYTSSLDGLQGILTLRPALVFLDIEMPVMNGFQLLERLGEVSFYVVFVTAYDKYAVRAFRFSALDYLLKPIDTIELVSAVRRAEQASRIRPQQVEMLRQHYPHWPDTTHGTSLPGKIALPHANSLVFVETRRILYCEADSNYTRIHLDGGEQFMIAKTLGDVQEVLEMGDFLRVHRQYVVNINQISKLQKGEGVYLLMSNGMSIPVARQQRDRLMERFGWL